MAFTLYDTRQRALVPLQPREAGKVSIYNCGPTVYSEAHIGNFRSFLFADLLRRCLEWRGYAVTQVMNITDVGHLTEDDRADAAGEDKLQKKARELGWDPFRVARHFEDRFHEDRRALGIQDASVYPRATDNIREMLVQIQQLIDRGHAYVPAGSGEVYYDISTFADYGKLSGKTLEDLRAGARVEVNELKRHPADFALWKADASHLMQWDPHSDELWQGFAGARPQLDRGIGKGFPGWHIECSAMSERYLGTAFDLHTGGEDNMFPHHECEIAQAQGASGGEFARHWMHARHLLVNGAKMSKSAGTLYRLADILALGYKAVELRYLLISNHYRQPMNFTLEGLAAARSSVQRLQNARASLHERAGGAAPTGAAASAAAPSAAVAERISVFERDFAAGLDDDLNISNALAALFAFVADCHRLEPSAPDAAQLLRALDRADHVLNVANQGADRAGVIKKSELEQGEALKLDAAALQALLAQEITPEHVREIARARHHARRQKDWATADAIRNHLQKAGVQFEDTPDGVRYKLP